MSHYITQTNPVSSLREVSTNKEQVLCADLRMSNESNYYPVHYKVKVKNLIDYKSTSANLFILSILDRYCKMLQRTFKGSLLQAAVLNNIRSFCKQKPISHMQQGINTNVPGLSEKCCKVPTKPVGPKAAKDTEYKNPEYFCYHTDSFAEAEVELAKFRLPAPSNKRPFER